MKIIAITQARFSSSRLLGKVLKRINEETLLSIHLKRALLSKHISKLIVATTHEPKAQEICAIAQECGASCYMGSMDDVLDRFYQSVKNEQADYVVRITSDCPLIDPVLIDEIIQYTVNNKLDYCTNAQSERYPDGIDVEVFTFNALETAWKEAKLISEREHVTPYIWKNSPIKNGNRFKAEHYSYPKDYSNVRMTVDEEVDFIMLQKLIAKLGIDKSWLQYADYIVQNPEIMSINANVIRNEGYIKSIKND
jgi:spore coat polysaccharide biosynthesis protein SpsF (cytidylyltransferase family)